MPGQRLADVSSNNPHPIDWAAVKASGIDAVLVKATEGTGYVNPFYAGDMAAARAAGLAAAGYHFRGSGSPQAEAAFFYSVAGADAKVLDAETTSDVGWFNAFLAALPFPPSEEMTYGSASDLPQAGIRSLLWPASYGRDYGFGDCWQFTDAAAIAGINGDVDESVWLGSDNSFNVFFGLVPPTPGGGSVSLNAPIVDIFPTASGNGYWQVGADGGVFCEGDAQMFGSEGGQPLNKPIVAAARTPSGQGYWLIAADGGVFSFGDAASFPDNPLPGMTLAAPVVGVAPTPSGQGLWLTGADGGMFCLGDAAFFGRAGA